MPDTSSVVSLIGLFQVNITFGLLYIGLPELRFRRWDFIRLFFFVHYST